MQEQKTATLTTIFSEVLASLAFMFTDDEQADASPDVQWLETTIGYHGPVSGELRLWCTRDFSILLAGNLLGTGPQDDNVESIADDAVKEFMNIICGQFITASHGTDAVFNLTIPQITKTDKTPDFHRDDPLTSTLSVNQHRLQLSYIPGESDAGA